MTGDVLLQSCSRAWLRSRRVLRRIWKHQNCSVRTWHCVSNHWRPVSRSRSCRTPRTHNISSQRNAAEEIMAGKPRHLFLPTIFQSRPVRETPIVGAASSRDRGRSVSEGSAVTHRRHGRSLGRVAPDLTRSTSRFRAAERIEKCCGHGQTRPLRDRRDGLGHLEPDLGAAGVPRRVRCLPGELRAGKVGPHPRKLAASLTCSRPRAQLASRGDHPAELAVTF
jgi:hypothetical protein